MGGGGPTRSRAARLGPGGRPGGGPFSGTPAAIPGSTSAITRQMGEVGDDQRGRGPLGDENPRPGAPSPKPAESPMAALSGPPDCSPAGRIERGDRQFLHPGSTPRRTTRPQLTVPARKATDEEQLGVEWSPIISTAVATTDIPAAGTTTTVSPTPIGLTPGPPHQEGGDQPEGVDPEHSASFQAEGQTQVPVVGDQEGGELVGPPSDPPEHHPRATASQLRR